MTALDRLITLPPVPRPDVLLVSHQQFSPAARPERVVGLALARALDELGIEVRLASLRSSRDLPPSLERLTAPWPAGSPDDVRSMLRGWSGPASGLRRSLATRSGLSARALAGLHRLTAEMKPRCVLALGPHGPILLAAVQCNGQSPQRLWYAHEEPVTQLTRCLRHDAAGQWLPRLGLIARFGLLEPLFGGHIDAVLGSTPAVTRRLVLATAVANWGTLPVGTDVEAPCRPLRAVLQPTLLAPGHADHEPFIHGLRWFFARVWPVLLTRRPEAALVIAADRLSPAIASLAKEANVRIVTGLSEVDRVARTGVITIFPQPFGRGGSLDLLHAAALGSPIVAQERLCRDLGFAADSPAVAACRRPEQWVESVWRIWTDPTYVMSLSRAARQHVEQHRRWSGAAQWLAQFVNRALPAAERIAVNAAPTLVGRIAPQPSVAPAQIPATALRRAA